MCNFSRDGFCLLNLLVLALSSFMFVQEVFYLCFGLILLPRFVRRATGLAKAVI